MTSKGAAFIFAHCWVLSPPDVSDWILPPFPGRVYIQTCSGNASFHRLKLLLCHKGSKSIQTHTWPSRTNRDVSASVPLSGEPNGCCPRPAPTGAASAWLQHSLWLGHATLWECQPAGQELRSTCWFSYSLHYHHRLCRFYCFHWKKYIVFV